MLASAIRKFAEFSSKRRRFSAEIVKERLSEAYTERDFPRISVGVGNGRLMAGPISPWARDLGNLRGWRRMKIATNPLGDFVSTRRNSGRSAGGSDLRTRSRPKFPALYSALSADSGNFSGWLAEFEIFRGGRKASEEKIAGAQGRLGRLSGTTGLISRKFPGSRKNSRESAELPRRAEETSPIFSR